MVMLIGSILAHTSIVAVDERDLIICIMTLELCVDVQYVLHVTSRTLLHLYFALLARNTSVSVVLLR